MANGIGTSASEHLNGGSGADRINGGAGCDRINGGSGDDVLDGGSGSDRVSGDAGRDTLVYVAAQNRCATDVYDGGSGADVLRLVLTRAEWMDAALQRDVARLLDFLARETDGKKGEASNAEFRFTAFDLRTSKLETLEIVVDGVALDPRDAAVTLGADALSATEDAAGLAVDLLANDRVADLVRSVAHTQAAHGTVAVTFAPGDATRAASARAVYTPDARHWQSLAAGQTGTDSFSYTVTDADGDTATRVVTVTITGTNDAPVARADIAAAGENGSVAIDVLANDTDVDNGAVLTVTGAQAPAGRGVASVADNRVVFAPGADFDHLAAGATEVVTIAYTLSDGAGGVAGGTITVTVTGANDGPVVSSAAADAAGRVAEAGVADDGGIVAGTPSATGRLASTDVDDGATATWSGARDGVYGSFAISAAGVWTYALDQNRAGALAEGETRVESFIATVTDDKGATATQLVTIAIAGTNDAPVVTSDAAAAAGSVREAGIGADGAAAPANADAAGVLTSADVDAGATAVWSGGGAGAYGAFAIAANGAWTYRLDDASAATQALAAGETRVETFAATVTDDKGATARQVVSVTVTGANDAPAIVAAGTTASGAVREDAGQIAAGRIAFADPDAGDAHVAAATPRGSGYVGALTLGPVDEAGGGVGWTFGAADGALDYLAAGETRTQVYDVEIADGRGGVARQAVSVTITGTNDAPTIDVARSVASADIAEGASANHAAGGRIVFADADAIDVHAAAVAAEGAGYLGALTLGAADAAGRFVDWSFAVNDAILDALGAGETRVQTYLVSISDGQGGTAAQRIAVTITGANDAPKVSGAVTGAVAQDGAASTLHALANASDADAGARLSVRDVPDALPAGVSFDAKSQGFTLDPAAYRALAAGQVATVSVAYRVTDGADSAEASVAWTVTGTNDAPTVSGMVTGASTDGGAVSTLSALANASDVDAGATLEVAGLPETLPPGVTWNAAAQSFSLDPAAYRRLAAGEVAQVSVAYRVSDGVASAPASVGWTVTGVNDAPVVTGAVTGTAVEDGAASTLNALANATDADAGATLEVRGLPDALPAGVTFDAAKQSFTLDPKAYQSLAEGRTTTVSVAYGIWDGTSETPAMASWTVIGVNDAPVVSGAVVGTAVEDGPVSTLNALANATDADAGATLEVRGLPDALPAGVTFDAGTQRFTLDPKAYQSLADGRSVTVSVAYEVWDGRSATPAMASWTVTGVNDAPVVTGAVAGVAVEDGAVSTLNALANASDPDAGATLEVRGLPDALPAGVTFNETTRSFTLDPKAYQSLADGRTATVSVAYEVWDGTSATPASVSWTVTGVNDAPVVTGAVVGTATEGGSASRLNALGNVSDVDAGAALTVVGVPVDLPPGVSYDAETRTFALDPSVSAYASLPAGAVATVAVAYRVSDGVSATEASVRWTVTGTNGDPVVAGAVTGEAVEDGAMSTLNALANASDGDAGSALRVTDVPTTLPPGVTYDADARTFTLDPSVAAYQSLAPGESITVSVAYAVSDGTGATPASVAWTVMGANDAPVVTASSDGTVGEDVAVDAGGRVGATGSLSYVDPDGRGAAAVAVAAVPDAYIGVFAAALAQDGQVVWTFAADNAQLQFLAGTQTLVQDYEVTIDDGQGGSVTRSVSVTIGGANDEIVRGDTIESPVTYVDGVRMRSVRFFFTDADLADVHTGTAVKRVTDSIGEVTASAIGKDEDGRFYMDVEYRHAEAEIDALPADLLDWRYQVRISDNAGDELVANRVTVLDGVDYYIGGTGNDDLGRGPRDRSVLIGGGGSDRLTGGARDDALFGDGGPDLPSLLENVHDGIAYVGNAYDDLLNGGDGSDYLTGGAGADGFQFKMGEAQGDVVTDFSRVEGDYLFFQGWGPDATFKKIDGTHWELANANRSVVEVITFSNAPDIQPSDYLFY